VSIRNVGNHLSYTRHHISGDVSQWEPQTSLRRIIGHFLFNLFFTKIYVCRLLAVTSTELLQSCCDLVQRLCVCTVKHLTDNWFPQIFWTKKKITFLQSVVLYASQNTSAMCILLSGNSSRFGWNAAHYYFLFLFILVQFILGFEQVSKEFYSPSTGFHENIYLYYGSITLCTVHSFQFMLKPALL
jgi:hypothetical protein